MCHTPNVSCLCNIVHVYITIFHEVYRLPYSKHQWFVCINFPQISSSLHAKLSYSKVIHIPGPTIVYNFFDLNRSIQYTFIRDMRILEVGGHKTWVVLARSHTFPGVAEKSGVIRVDNFTQACVMQSDGNVGAKGIDRPEFRNDGHYHIHDSTPLL